MRYYIASKVNGELENYYKILIAEMSSVINSKKLEEKARIPHITLKSPFEIQDISLIEDFLLESCKRFNNNNIKVTGFGKFEDRTLFLKLNPSKEFLDFYKNLQEYIKQQALSISIYDLDKKIFHITIANKELSSQEILKIWESIGERTLNIQHSVDNICLFKNENEEKGVIYKKFLI